MKLYLQPANKVLTIEHKLSMEYTLFSQRSEWGADFKNLSEDYLR